MKQYEDIALDKLESIQPATNKEWATACGYNSTQAFYHTFNKLRKLKKIKQATFISPVKWIVNRSDEDE